MLCVVVLHINFLPPRNRSDDEKRFFSRGNFFRQRSIGLVEGEIFSACKKSQKRTALLGHMVADGSGKHRKLRLQGIEHGPLRDRPRDIELNFRIDARQISQMIWERDADHASVWTSTENTAGRSRTIGIQLSPESGEQYTWPPVVPK